MRHVFRFLETPLLQGVAAFVMRRRAGMGLSVLCCFCVAVLSAADAWASPPARAEGAACIGDLSYRDVAFDRGQDFKNEKGCGVKTAVRVRALATAALSRPTTMDCMLGAALSDYEAGVLQPLARRLLGSPIAVIDVYGGYVCRGRANDAARLSEHATGQAVDLGAFVLEDGTIVSVRRDWKNKGRKGVFLRQAAQAACPYFSAVLTPKSNAAHYDHFHFDLGPWTSCAP